MCCEGEMGKNYKKGVSSDLDVLRYLCSDCQSDRQELRS